jgi:hypothetical protein
MLIESSKSKLVKGLNIEDKHIRKFNQDDKHVCDVCARAKITRHSFNKLHKIRGKLLGDYISCDIAVFKNCPSRGGYLYVVQFLDHATKFCWVYPMKTRDESIEKLRDVVDVQLVKFGAKIKHYHADGAAELISKQVLALLKREGATYSWNPVETPELNATTERRFRTLSERALSMLLRSGLPVDFWWDAYETSNFITNRLPTKTAFGYQTPFEGIFGEIPDLSLLRVWGCKTYLKIPKNYLRKDWREKCTSGYLMGYSVEGEMGYKIYVPELKEIVTGVNCLFNEVIPTYREEYFNELNKMKFELAEAESTVESFEHLIGVRYIDDESLLEFETTRVINLKGLIVGYRAPVLRNGILGVEEKSPIHIADVVRMYGLLISSPTQRPDQDEPVRGILKQAQSSAKQSVKSKKHSNEEKGCVSKKRHVRCDLQELGSGGHEEPRRKAGELNSSTATTGELNIFAAQRSAATEHTTVQDSVLGHEPKTGPHPSRIVTRYDAIPSEANIEMHIDEKNPHISERDSTDVSADYDAFVAHKWSKTDTPAKRIRIPRNAINVNKLGNVFAVSGGDEKAAVDEVFQESTEPVEKNPSEFSTVGENEEVKPESYGQAVLDPEWRKSMMSEIKALRNRGCWRVVQTPRGVRLIKSKYVYKLKRDWQGKVTKRKSRLVVQGFLQREGQDFNVTYAPVAKATTFRLMLALTQAYKLHLHQLDVDSAFLYADLDEEVFMTPPPGMELEEEFCLKLLKSLYGLKQAPRNWNKNIVEHIKSLGFKQCVLDNCLFVKQSGGNMYLISLYVDDILVAGSNLEEVENIKRQFTKRYEMKDLGELNYYLGMKITRTQNAIKLDQSGYVRDILEKYGYLLAGKEGKVVNTPMERDLKLRKSESRSMTANQRAYMLTHSLIIILWEHYYTWHSLQDQISHMQWEY